MEHHQAEIDLIKILHDLKCPHSAFDTIFNWTAQWNSNNVIFDLSSNYEFNKTRSATLYFIF